jgi:hypothetical protein
MSSRHQFHLRWSNYGHNLANSFVRLFESESLADVTLFCEGTFRTITDMKIQQTIVNPASVKTYTLSHFFLLGESYRAHRVVLAASSVHFQELFEQCSSAQNLVVILDGTSPANLRALLEFMYKGEVYIDDANLNTFLQTAKRLQVKGLSLSQSDLHSISNDANDEGHKGGGDSSNTSNNLLAQALGPNQQQQQQGGSQGSSGGQSNAQQQQQQQQGGNKQGSSNNVQSPPTSFSSPSPSQTPPHPPTSSSAGEWYLRYQAMFREMSLLMCCWFMLVRVVH